jgi:hypothetical protein
LRPSCSKRALTRDGEGVVGDLDPDVVLAQAGQVGPQDEVVVGLDEVHRGHPAAGRGAAVRRAGLDGRVEERVEQAVHLLLDRVELTNRLPADKRHE